MLSLSFRLTRCWFLLCPVLIVLIIPVHLSLHRSAPLKGLQCHVCPIQTKASTPKTTILTFTVQ